MSRVKLSHGLTHIFPIELHNSTLSEIQFLPVASHSALASHRVCSLTLCFSIFLPPHSSHHWHYSVFSNMPMTPSSLTRYNFQTNLTSFTDFTCFFTFLVQLWRSCFKYTQLGSYTVWLVWCQRLRFLPVLPSVNNAVSDVSQSCNSAASLVLLLTTNVS